MDGKKILVTGHNGMLGSAILNSTESKNIVGFNIDITDSISVQKKLYEEKPDVVIHTAAYTNVEECETNPDKTYLVNSVGTQNLVNYCTNKDILFIFVSSTGIYGTEKKDKPYNEFDNVNPATIHHKSKYEGERIVQSHLSRYLILRTGWLYGGDIKSNKNFVFKRYIEAKDNDVIYSNNTQIGNPTYVLELVEQIKVLIENNLYGIYNCVNSAENISRYNYVKKIVELFDAKCIVKVGNKNMFTRTAPVSDNESAINYKLDLIGLNVMCNWEIALENYIMTNEFYK